MAWFEKSLYRWLGKTALTRVENLIAAKHEEIAQIEKAQLEDELSIQKRIDEVDAHILALRKKRKRVQAELESAKVRNKHRVDQMNSELRELSANADSLTKPSTYGTPAGQTLEFRAFEK